MITLFIIILLLAILFYLTLPNLHYAIVLILHSIKVSHSFFNNNLKYLIYLFPQAIVVIIESKSLILIFFVQRKP